MNYVRFRAQKFRTLRRIKAPGKGKAIREILPYVDGSISDSSKL